MEKAPLSVACSSFQLILWPVSEHEEPNKQKGIHGWSEGAETETQRRAYSIQQVCVGREGWEGSSRISVECAGVFACEVPTGVYYVF